MHIHPSTTVRELAVSISGATALFESFRIDYCCHGGRSLAQACADASVRVADVVHELERLATQRELPDTVRWDREPVAKLVRHILQRHHPYTRTALEAVNRLSEKVTSVHGARHAALVRLRDHCRDLYDDLGPHMDKEEIVLFPYIEGLEASQGHRGLRLNAPPFGSIDRPIAAMLSEHEHVGQLLREIRALTDDYTPPPEACTTWRALYAELRSLEHDLFEHIHLESNVLFPRASSLATA